MSREELRVVEGYLNLFRAIKRQAEKDDLSEEFWKYWYYSPGMSHVWRAICEEIGVVLDLSMYLSSDEKTP